MSIINNDLRIFALIGFIAILLMGCGQPLKGIHDDAFKPYIEHFEQTFKASTQYTNVTFIASIADDPNSIYYTIGYCQGRDVKILKSFWDWSTNSEKRTVIFHELGHCVLNLEHDDHLNTRWNDGCPNSFMNSILISDECYTLRYGKDVFSD